MSTPILPFAVWESGTQQASIPANDNSLRNQILNGLVIDDATTAQPGSPSEGDIYILAATHTGSQWAGFAEDDLVIFSGGTWYAFEPVDGVVVNFDGVQMQWTTGGGWVEIGGSSGTAGRHAIPIMAASMQPSVTGGCGALLTSPSGSNLPDMAHLPFDATTQEYAQFAIPMPKSWDEGTITFKPLWSHGATTTNFGVVWDLQAVALSNDDAIGTAFGTAQTSSDTGGTTDDLYVGPESSAITVGGSPAAEDVVFFRISRVTGNGSDTMAIDARLMGLVLYVTTDAENDA